MGSEQPAAFYDTAYAKPRPVPTKNIGRALWQWCGRRVREGDVVVELGCGAGEFTEFLPDCEYLGLDFSGVAIEAAQAAYPHRVFAEARLANAHLAMPVDISCVVAIETLEHVRADRRVIRNIPHGVRIIGTLPSGDSAGHAWYPTSINEIVKRYGQWVRFDEVVTLHVATRHHYAFCGVRRGE